MTILEAELASMIRTRRPLRREDYSLKLWMGALDDYVELEPFSFRLWPHPETPVTGRREPASFSPWFSGASTHDELGARAAGRYQYRSVSGRSEALSTRESPTARWSTWLR